MAKYLIIIEGFDPTSGPSTPTNAELLQLVRQAQYADDVGGLVLSETTPDVVLYPILARFRWVKTDNALIPLGEFYYHDGSSWVLEKPAPGTVTADSIADGTITLDKLSPDGDAYNIIRVNDTEDAFEFARIVDTIADGSFPYTKFVAASGVGYFLVSAGGGAWANVTSQSAGNTLHNAFGAATAIDTISDKIAVLNLSNNVVYNLTYSNFFKTGATKFTTLGTTEALDKVLVYDTSDSLTPKIVQLSDFLPDAGVVAGTYAPPSSITVNVKGQITAISAGNSSMLTAIGTDGIPAYGASATFVHGFSPAIPSMVRAVLKCTGTNNGFVAGDEVDIAKVGWSAANTGIPAFTVTADATNVVVSLEKDTTDSNIFMHDKGTGARFFLSSFLSSWQIKVYAAR